MRERRGLADTRRLCQALAITAALDGAAFDAPPFVLVPRTHNVGVLAGRRVGITRGVETEWRFWLAGSPFVSRTVRN